MSSGHWVGTPARDPNPALTSKQRAWTNQATRAVRVPAGLSPGGPAPCMSGESSASARCLDDVPRNAAPVIEVTPVGTYQPLPYLLPAAVVRAADTASAADRLGRLATLVVWLALLGAAAWLLADALGGLLLAITPQVIFVGTSLTGSSLEIAASIAFFAALLRLPRRGAWIVAAVAGATLALSRSPGPVWVVLDIALWAALAGRATLVELWRAHRRPVVLTLAALAAAIGLNRFWEARYGPHVDTSLLPSFESLKAGRRQLTDVLDELVGSFGYLDTSLAWPAAAAWGLLLAGLVVAALRAGRARERWVLLLVLAVVLVAPMYLFAAVTRHTGFGLQGRHVLPLAVVLPLVAAEILRRRATAFALAALGVAVAAIQLLAWWTNARRYAVGDDGSWWFFADAQWSPPGGWSLWALVTLAGVVALSLGVLKAPRRA